MHQIHHTEGIIISGREKGEASRHLLIFTRDFGMVYASAQGVRKVDSKMKYGLQDFSYSRISLVKGKEIWRVVNSEKIKDLGQMPNFSSAEILDNVLRLISRLCQGEEVNEPLFDHLLESLSFLKENKIDLKQLKNLELLIVLRTLFHLGYLAEPLFSDDLVSQPISTEILALSESVRRGILSQVNRSMKASHL